MVSTVEIVATVAALGFAAWLMHRQRSGVVGLILMGCVAAGVAVGAATHHSGLARLAADREIVLAEVPRLERSDDGFVTSQTCQACHPREYETWHDSYHRTMTQVASPQTVIGDFDDVTLNEGEYVYRLTRDELGFYVDMVDFEWERKRAQQGREPDPMKARPRTKQRIVMTTGSHYMQTYWYPSQDGNELLNFPFVFLRDEQRWAPRSDVFMRPPDSPPMRQRWNDNCLGCHTTYGQPLRSKEGFDTAVAELGIACEACHGPAEQHVQRHRNPLDRYFRHLASHTPDTTIVNPARLPAARSAEVCGQCHSKSWINDFKSFNDHGLKYRPGSELAQSKTVVSPRSDPEHPWLKQSLQRDASFLDQFFWSDGMIRVSGRELNGLVESKCYSGGELSCLNCHSLHGGDRNMHLPAQDQDAPCLDCHPSIAADVSAHTHHPADSEGNRCVNCHMPYTTYGLMRAMRSHLIDSPAVAKTVQTGRPNACNGCHIDQPLGWAAEHLQTWYGIEPPPLDDEDRTVSAFVRAITEGDAGQRAIAGWTASWPPAREAAGASWLAPLVIPLLDDPYATVRYIAGKTLRTLPGYEGFDFDFVTSDRGKKQSEALRLWSTPAAANPATLMTGSGVDEEALQRHQARRDDRKVDLKE